MEQEEKLCDDVEIVRNFTHLCDRVSASGVCEAAVTARTRCWWVKIMDCGELPYGRFPPKLKLVVHKS